MSEDVACVSRLFFCVFCVARARPKTGARDTAHQKPVMGEEFCLF
jgi:hypothetical protein